jgi:hypothetical protein
MSWGWGIARSGNDFGDQLEREMNRIRGAWAIGLAVGNAVEVYLIENGNVDALGRSLLGGLRPRHKEALLSPG